MDATGSRHRSKPWFMYFAPGGIHAPHHAPKAFRDKYRGRLDMGWDKYREQTFERQKALGWIPKNTKLTPRPKQIPAWDAQPEDAKRVFRRLAENYSAYLEHTDVQVGRVIDAVAQAGNSTIRSSSISWVTTVQAVRAAFRAHPMKVQVLTAFS